LGLSCSFKGFCYQPHLCKVALEGRPAEERILVWEVSRQRTEGSPQHQKRDLSGTADKGFYSARFFFLGGMRCCCFFLNGIECCQDLATPAVTSDQPHSAKSKRLLVPGFFFFSPFCFLTSVDRAIELTVFENFDFELA